MRRRLVDAPSRSWPLALPTPRTTENDLSVTCNKCLRSVYADIPGLIAAGCGDTPLRELRFVCSGERPESRGCGSDDTFAVVAELGMRATDGLLARYALEQLPARGCQHRSFP